MMGMGRGIMKMVIMGQVDDEMMIMMIAMTMMRLMEKKGNGSKMMMKLMTKLDWG